MVQMARQISVSDELYAELDKEKVGDESFGSVIKRALQSMRSKKK